MKKELPFEFKLVLNQWISKILGFDMLANKMDRDSSFRFTRPFPDMPTLKQVGLDNDGLHFFYKHAAEALPQQAEITKEALLRYEQNIVQHTASINAGRDDRIAWKYYQWLSLLYTEIYLEKYFNDPHSLRSSLNHYVQDYNVRCKELGFKTEMTSFKAGELNKICCQNATGSGKTLLMHANLLQFQHYAQSSPMKNDLARCILITPNEELSEQHIRELTASGIQSIRMQAGEGNFFASEHGRFQPVEVTEITKLGNEDGPKTIDVTRLGDQNLLLVDEGHRGLGNKENNKGWFATRGKLVENGFAFEYSATFKEATQAANNPQITETYAKSVLTDYSYQYFYGDGYGKDYRIFNLPRSPEDLQFTYLTAALLTFYQQMIFYCNHVDICKNYNLAKPLWVFVGAKVATTKGEQGTISDVGKIISFLASFLSKPSAAEKEIDRILSGRGEDTGLIDNEGNDIFSNSFDYLRGFVENQKWSPANLRKKIAECVFSSVSGRELSIGRLSGNDNEVLLYTSDVSNPFGLINVGDASALITHIQEQKPDNVVVVDSAFGQPLFSQINKSSSPINILIGAKRFIEGWDCWRVSTLGLMHVGRSEGSQIIQLFGRGVRLKGHKCSLKRSGFATPGKQPDHIQYLETLNVFGIEADFMERFKNFLAEEHLPSNNRKNFRIPLNVTYDFGHNLMVLRPRIKRDSGREYDFQQDGRPPLFGDIPSKLRNSPITADWYPRIAARESDGIIREGKKHEDAFSSIHISLLDERKLFFELEHHKKLRGWNNLNIPKSSITALLANQEWYKLMVPKARMDFGKIDNVAIWQEMAADILKKYAGWLYNYHKSAFIKPRLELRPLDRNDPNIPDSDTYELIVDASETQLIKDIETLSQELCDRRSGMLAQGQLRGCHFARHIYEPVLHAHKDTRIQIKPVSLVESEIVFIDHLVRFLEAPSCWLNDLNVQTFLLRNESRGRGMGFFEADNFHPDFLLWLVSGKRQSLVFIEPHGLQYEKPASKKIEFFKTIKDIQHRLSNPDITLSSFIVTPTQYANLVWGQSIEELNDKNVYFMKDQKEDYLHKIFSKIVIDSGFNDKSA